MDSRRMSLCIIDTSPTAESMQFAGRDGAIWRTGGQLVRADKLQGRGYVAMGRPIFVSDRFVWYLVAQSRNRYMPAHRRAPGNAGHCPIPRIGVRKRAS